MIKIKIQIDDIELDGEITDGLFKDLLPIVGVTRRHGDECYFIVNYENNYTSTQTEFEAGDIVYWKSNKGWKQAIALFFGNTPDQDGSRPRTPSEAIKIGSFTFNEDVKKTIKTGDVGRISRVE